MTWPDVSTSLTMKSANLEVRGVERRMSESKRREGVQSALSTRRLHDCQSDAYSKVHFYTVHSVALSDQCSLQWPPPLMFHPALPCSSPPPSFVPRVLFQLAPCGNSQRRASR